MGKKDYRRDKKVKAAKRNRTILIVVAAIVAVALVGALIFALLPSKDAKKNNDNNSQNQGENNDVQTKGEVVVPVADGKYTAADSSSDYVKINVSFTDANHEQRTGDIVIQLRPDCAPITVENFKKLVAQGDYDGTDFSRIIKGFMIQGGRNDALVADTIKGEFSENGIDNPLLHVRGTISMARGFLNDSASTQFFIVDQTSARNTYSLDGKYAAFGSVVFGIENVDNIADQEVVYSPTYDEDCAPEHPVTINSMTFVTPVE